MDKKLTIKNLEIEKAKIEKTKKITLSNGDYLEIKPVLSRNDVEKIISNYSTFLIDKDVKNTMKKNELTLFLQAFIILYNSNLCDDINLVSQSDKLKFCTLLTNNYQLFDEILSEYNQKSIDTLLDKFKIIIQTAKNLEKSNAKEIRKKMLKGKK